MGDGAAGAPGEGVAGALGDEEGLGAALVAVGVDALLDGEVEDLARGDGLAGCGGFVSERLGMGLGGNGESEVRWGEGLVD